MKNLNSTDILFTMPGTDISHQLIFSYWKKDLIQKKGQKPLVYCSVFLNKFPFWKRLKIGLRYIFGKEPSSLGYFDEFVFTPDDGVKLEQLAKYLNNIKINDYIKKYPDLKISEIRKKIKEEDES